jgi:MFS family permease
VFSFAKIVFAASELFSSASSLQTARCPGMIAAMGQPNDAQVAKLDDQAEADRPPLPGARISLVLLLCINLFNYVDRYVLAAVEPQIQHTFFPKSAENDPHTLTLMGSLSTAFILSYMITAPIFGWLADRMSRWLLVGASVLLWSVATASTGLAPTFALLLITRLFVGVGEAGYGPAAPTIISDLYPVSRRGAVLAWFYMAIPVGSAIGYGVGAVIEPHFGWRTAFLAVTPPGLLLGIFCFLRKDPRRGQADVASSDPAVAIAQLAETGDDSNSSADPAASNDPNADSGSRAGAPKSVPDRNHGSRPLQWKDYLTLFRTPSYLLDTAGMAAMTFAIGGIAYWMPKYIDQDRHAPNLVAGVGNGVIFGAITAVAGIIATLLGGIAGDKLRARFSGAYFLVSGVGILIACPFIFLIAITPFPYAWIMIFMAEFFLFFNTGPSNTILANVTHPSVRATAFALNIFVIHAIGDAPSPPLLGNFAGHFGWTATFAFIAGVTALGGFLWLLGVPYLARDTRMAPLRA